MKAPLLSASNIRVLCLYLVIFLQLSVRVHGGTLYNLAGGFFDFAERILCIFSLGACGQTDDPNGLCPIVSPLGEDEFDLDEYIAKTWYVQRQQPNVYQDEDDLFCVTATYERTLFGGAVKVNNYQNEGGVNSGASEGAEGFYRIFGQFAGLYARQVEGGEIRVAPGALGIQVPIADGPYWVVAVADDYNWAIIVGGQPDQIRENNETSTVTCTTQEEGDNILDFTGGLWFFSRERFASNETLATMEATLADLGIYGGDMIDVVHEECEYVGAILK